MKLRQLKAEVALFELREQIGILLAESISDYLSRTIAMLKNDKQVDLDQLAEFISGLTAIGDDENRISMTKADIGINPNDFKELFNTLNSVTKDGKNMPRMTIDVFNALKSITPSQFKKTREELSILENGTKGEKEQVIRKVQAFATKVNQFFYKIKHGASKPKEKTVTAVIGDQFDLEGGFPN